MPELRETVRIKRPNLTKPFNDFLITELLH